jgi:phosphatidylglycerophosphatase A
MSTPGAREAFRRHPFAAFFALGLGSGLSPIAPGTAGSAVALALAWLLARAIEPSHGASVTAGVGLLASGLAIAVIAVPVSTRVARVLSQKDPGCVVLDEFAGQFLAAAPVPFFRYGSAVAAAAAWLASFLLFRIFDVWKPGPVHRLQDLPEGWGIVADDVLAGLLAAGGTLVVATLLSAQAWI